MINGLVSSLPLTLAEGSPIEHVLNHPAPGMVRDGVWYWSANATNLVLSGVIVVALMWWVATQVDTGPESDGPRRYITRNPFAHMIEVMCVYLRDQVVRPLLGERTDKFMPFLWTLFFFILVNNLLGLVPLLDLSFIFRPTWRAQHASWIGGTATQNLMVTGALALIAALVINVAGVLELGVGGYLKHLTGGAPAYVWPLMVPIELMGNVIKPVALAIRLFANMTAGHTLLATLAGFIGTALFGTLGVLVGFGVVTAATIGSIAIYFLEIFVAFLQAFIFMFLTAVFISLLAHHEYEHGHDHAHAPSGASPAH